MSRTDKKSVIIAEDHNAENFDNLKSKKQKPKPDKAKFKKTKRLTLTATLASQQRLYKFFGIKPEAILVKKKIAKKKPPRKPRNSKTYATPADLGSIKILEHFVQLKPEDSFFDGKKEQLEKILIFSANKKFSRKIEGKPWKIFSKGQFIYYCIGYDDYYALDAITEKIVGTALLENDWLKSIEVDVNYRRRGIGTNLMRAIVKTIGPKFHIPGEGILGVSSYYLTTEGAHLIHHCLDKKIIKEEQCLLDVPPRTPVYSPLSPY